MAKEIQATHTTGRTVYAQLWNTVGQVYHTSSGFQTYQTANIGSYNIALTELGTASGVYCGDMPAIAQGAYGITVRERAGGSPAEADTLIASGVIHWDGTAVVARGTLVSDAITSGKIAADAIGSSELAATAANEIADALLDRSDGVEVGWTLRKALRVILAALAGKLSGAATTSIAIRDVTDSKDRIQATVDSDGNRTSVTLDGT